MRELAIRLQGVGKCYRSYARDLDRVLEVLSGKPRHHAFHALQPLDLEVARGDGAGKSTLLKLLAVLERPTEGRVLVGGENVSALKRAALPYWRRSIGLIMQDQRLLFDRSAFDNVMLPLSISSHPPEPTGNLDSQNGEQVMDLLRELHRAGATICKVTHDPRYAKYADRTIHLFDGRIVEETRETPAA